jgi:chromosome segregation ATPase
VSASLTSKEHALLRTKSELSDLDVAFEGQRTVNIDLSTKIKQIESDLSSSNKTLKVQTDELDTTKAHMAARQRALDEAIAKYKKLEGDHTELGIIHGNTNLEVEQQRVKINSLHAEATSHRSDIDKLKGKETELEASVRQQREVIDRTTTELTGAQQAALAARTKISGFETAQIQLEDEVERLGLNWTRRLESAVNIKQTWKELKATYRH